MNIPKIIHQVHTRGLQGLTDVDKRAIELLKKNNPDWDYSFYDYNQMVDFIKKNYSNRYVNAFYKINPIYGAAQADYFRYLLMYKLGGAYFDVKSFTTCSLNNLILPNDDLIVFEWQGGDPRYESFGRHEEIIRGREYQQWNIICSPYNKYLENVIEKVTSNIESYTVSKFKSGWYGVIHTTGPVPYTNAIHEVENQSGVRLLGSSCKNGLIFKDFYQQSTDKNHYSKQTKRVILSRTDFVLLKIWKKISLIKNILKSRLE